MVLLDLKTWKLWLCNTPQFHFIKLPLLHLRCRIQSSSRVTDCVSPLTWQEGCQKGTIWFGGPCLSVSGWAFLATSLPFGLWGLHTSPPSSCTVFERQMQIMCRSCRMTVQGCAEDSRQRMETHRFECAAVRRRRSCWDLQRYLPAIAQIKMNIYIL